MGNSLTFVEDEVELSNHVASARGRPRQRRSRHSTIKRTQPTTPDFSDDVTRDLDHFAFDSDDDDNDDDDSSRWCSTQGSHLRDLRLIFEPQGNNKGGASATSPVSPKTLRAPLQESATPSSSPLLLAAPVLPVPKTLGNLVDFVSFDSFQQSVTGRDLRQGSPSWGLSFSRRPSTTSGSYVLHCSASPASQIHNRNDFGLRRRTSDNSAASPRHSARSRASSIKTSLDSRSFRDGHLGSSASVATAVLSSSEGYIRDSLDSPYMTVHQRGSSTISLPWLPLVSRGNLRGSAHDDEHATELLKDERKADLKIDSVGDRSSSPRSMATVFRTNATGHTVKAPSIRPSAPRTAAGRIRSKSDPRAVLESLTSLGVSRSRI